jgi:DHA2 family multidrug resistance protein
MNRLVGAVAQRRGDGFDAHAAALKQLWLLAYREASTLAYADAFRAIAVAFALAALLVPLMRAVTAATPASQH